MTSSGATPDGPDRTAEDRGRFEPNDDIGDEVHELAKSKLPHHDAFLDDPWHVLFRELDRWCPGSKFILTVRDPDEWIESVTRHFGYRDVPVRRWIYGVGDPVGHEDLYVRRYRRHIREVKDHFRDRPDDLLVMDITDGEGWEKLCPFLGHPVRREPFPKVNTAEQRETLKVKLGRLKRMAVSRVEGFFE